MSKENEQDVLLDHDYDGIRELDNKLPPWWLYLFYITIIWGIGYLIYYHVLGIGDSSYAEYMKEVDPEWTAPRAAAGPAFGYHSPLSGAGDLTPRKRMEMALAREAAARLAGGRELPDEQMLGELDFDQLILAAMKVSGPEDLEKLRTAFPGIWTRFQQEQAGSGPAAAAPAVQPLPEIEPFTDEVNLTAGKQVYQTNCVTCHGQNGEGGIGPNLTDDYYLHGSSMASTVSIIVNGVPAKGMIAWRGILKEEQIRQVASYILSLHGSSPPNAKAPQGEKIEFMN